MCSWETHCWEWHLQDIILYNSHFKNDRNESFYFHTAWKWRGHKGFLGSELTLSGKDKPLFEHEVTVLSAQEIRRQWLQRSPSACLAFLSHLVQGIIFFKLKPHRSFWLILEWANIGMACSLVTLTVYKVQGSMSNRGCQLAHTAVW